MWEAIREWIEEHVLLIYNPDRHTLPPRQAKRQTSGQAIGHASDINLAGHSLVRGQLWGPDMDDDSQTAHAAWRHDDVRNGFGQRQEALTDPDKLQLVARKLRLEKAMVIKPYWARGFTIPETSSILGKSGGKMVKGYSTRTVAEYFSAFSSATGGGEAA